MRLIDADALKKDLQESYERLREIYSSLRYDDEKQICDGQLTTFTECILRIKEAPTIEAEPVKHGRWEHDSIGFSDFWVCSACREAWFFEEDPVREATRVNYCPNCGAKMDLEEET